MSTNSEVLPCITIFGPAKAIEIIEFVERVTGSDCPCLQSRPCPLLPASD